MTKSNTQAGVTHGTRLPGLIGKINALFAKVHYTQTGCLGK